MMSNKLSLKTKPNMLEIPKHTLSKSTFMRGLQCPKSLWLYKNSYDLKDEVSDSQQGIFVAGTDVGLIARDIFPAGIDAAPIDPFHYQQSVADTTKYLKEGHKVIYEAAFQFEGVLAALDILVKRNGKWYGYEVKSSTQVKPQYLQDVALQYFVITNSGIKLEDIFLVHINNKYRRKGALDIQELFSQVSIKMEIKPFLTSIKTKIDEFKKVASLKDAPVIEIGKQCSKPYPCDFQSYCWKDFVPEPINIPDNIDKKEIKTFLNTLAYPVYYMDFETYNVVVPEYDGHWPYRQVPFQFSIHKQLRAGGPVEHFEFLASNDCDPCPDFVKSLINVLGVEGSIMVYNKAFENTRIKELLFDYPQYKRQLEKIQSRSVDLMVPFRKKHVYLNAMQGSYSIKYVLPALIPEMSYEGLTLANGADASTSFYNLRFEKDSQKVSETRKALLAYCELDTKAMVEIVNKLKTLI